MLTDPSVKRILLYGDSFVYGKASGANQRLDSKTRFSGQLQDLLGLGYEVIEEGLRARTLAGEHGFFPDRNGLAQFSPIIGSHLPVDLVIVMLGTNDCNALANKTPQEIADGLRAYPPRITEWCEFLAAPLPQLLIVAPPHIDDAHYDPPAQKIFGPNAPAKAAALPTLYAQTAKELGAHYANAAEVCEPAAGDGIHLNPVANKALAQLLYTRIKEIL
jgi:lysophospholipase L1-like esterase